MSTSSVSNSNLMKHLSMACTSAELVAKNTVFDTVDDDSRPGVANVSSANNGHGAVQAAAAGLFFSSFTKTCVIMLLRTCSRYPDAEY